ncbi:MAG: TetR/AcrR family transcriptional regulator [Lachnospiraceae bacterium]
MAKQIAGVYEKILDCAKTEFFDKGYTDASLRTIAQNAETSTSSIYTRFGDKKGLFDALVKEPAGELRRFYCDVQEEFAKEPPEYKAKEHFEYSRVKVGELVDYIYDHFDAFKLLIDCSEGAGYEDYVHDLIEVEIKYTLDFIESTGNDAIKSGRLSLELMHILSSGFLQGVFEMVSHNMTREQAHTYVEQLKRFYTMGWNDIFG